MRPTKIICILATTAVMITIVSAQDGEKLFKSNCASCHAFGKKLVGPDLIGSTDRYSEEWLIKWVKSSQSLIKSGDADAVKLFNDNNKIPMPDAFINEDEIKSVLAFIKTKSSEMAPGEGNQTTEMNNAIGNTVQNNPIAQESHITLLNQFSFAEYLMMGLISLMLIIIWILVLSIRTLTIQLTDKYNSNW